ncbi:MAG: FAD-dependent oxidoreductase [Acidobacteriota bacterium]
MSGVVIVGAGLTGLSAAYHLAAAGVPTRLFEALEVPGGACRTLEKDGFSFDLTGHLLHLRLAESRTLLEQLGVWGQLRRQRRRAGIALGGRVTPYPLQIHTHRLPPEVRRDCVLGFVRAAMSPQPQGEEEGSFAAWVLSRFGEGFARHFFFPYNEKLYCTPAAELTTEWVGRYVPRPRLEEVIDGAFGLHRGAVGYNATFYYPRQGGIRLLADALAARVPQLTLSAPVTGVDLARRRLTLAAGRSLEWDTLVWTAPLTSLTAVAGDLPGELAAAAGVLRAVAVLNLNLGVVGPPPRREHWLYIPEPRYPFYRVGFPSNHGEVAPAGCHTVSVEMSLPAGAPAPPGFEELCLAGLESLGLLRRRQDVVCTAVARLDPAYVVFDRPRTRAVATLRSGLRRHGVLLAGRWAEWKYSTMEDALWDGAAVARRLAP